MEKEFVTYELSKRLYLLGYNERNIYHYCNGLLQEGITYNSDDINRPYESVSAPLWQQAFRWFREKYGMYSHIKTSGKISVLEFTWVSNGKYGFFSKNGFETYEEAELACLGKLIEIVELKTE